MDPPSDDTNFNSNIRRSMVAALIAGVTGRVADIGNGLGSRGMASR